MVSRNEERAVRDMGRTALEKAAKAALDTVPPGISRRFATVTKLYGNGTCDVDMGSATSPQPLLGLRMTAGCMGVSVGARVIVDTVSHVSLVTGVLANDNLPYVHSFIGSKVVNVSNSDFVYLLQDAEIRSLVGAPQSGDMVVSVSATNGDWNAQNCHITGTAMQNGVCIAFFDSFRTGALRVNFTLSAAW